MKRILYFLFLSPLFLNHTCKKEKIEVTEATQPARPDQVRHDWLRAASFYEMNLRQMSADGKIGGGASFYPLRTFDLGFDAIILVPVQPTGKLNRTGTLGNPYLVSDYDTVALELGGSRPLEQLIRVAKSLGMKVVLDWNAVEVAADHEWVKNQSSFLLPADNPIPESRKLNYANPSMRKAMTEAMRWWVTRFDIDGFRCIGADRVPLDFWEENRRSLEQNKKLVWLADMAKTESEGNVNMSWFSQAFDAVVQHGFNQFSREAAGLKKDAYDMAAWMRANDSIYGNTLPQLRYQSSYGAPRGYESLEKQYGERWEPYMGLAYTLPGSLPMVASGQDLNPAQALPREEPAQLLWTDTTWQFWYRTMNRFRKEHPALWNQPGDSLQVLKLEGKNPSRVLAFRRQRDLDAVWVFVNLSDEVAYFKIPNVTLPQNPVMLFQNRLIGEPLNGYLLPPRGYVIYAER